MIGRRIWDLGLLAPVQTGLRDVAAPFLQDLYGATMATVHLAVRDGTLALYLDRLSGHGSVPVVSKVGARLPLHATGVGKVLLAYAPAEVRQAVLGGPLERFTAVHRRRGRDGWMRNCARVPRDGYATTAEEMTLGACSIGVPVLARRHGGGGARARAARPARAGRGCCPRCGWPPAASGAAWNRPTPAEPSTSGQRKPPVARTGGLAL